MPRIPTDNSKPRIPADQSRPRIPADQSRSGIAADQSRPRIPADSREPGSHRPRRETWEHLRLTDRVRPGVRVLFVGINPGVRSAVTGHHFAGYSNRFWKLLHESRLVPRPVTCEDDVSLPGWGYGITNLVPRPSPGIGELKPAEYAAARATLVRKIRRYKPNVVALVGVTLHRALFPERRREPITLGWQDERLGGARVFVLPNPSGRNANFSYAEMLAAFKSLPRRSLGEGGGLALSRQP